MTAARIAGLVAALALAAGAAAAAERRPVVPTADALSGLTDCPGGFALPGSRGCVRLSGSATSTLTLRSGSAAPLRSRLFSSTAQARAAADIRVPTEYGPVRAYVSVRAGGVRRTLEDGR